MVLFQVRGAQKFLVIRRHAVYTCAYPCCILHTQAVVACKQTFIISAAVQAFLHLQVNLKVLAKAS